MHALVVLLLGLLAAIAAADIAPFRNDGNYMAGAYSGYPKQTFLSTLDFHAPIANIKVEPQYGVSTSPLITLGPISSKNAQKRPVLMDANTFSVVWTGPQSAGKRAMSPKVHECNGQRYMAWFAGDFSATQHVNKVFIVNENYDVIRAISGIGEHKFVDLHEIYITEQCTVIYTMHHDDRLHPVLLDTPWFNGTVTAAYDSHFQEIDMFTGELLFEWQASVSIPNAFNDSALYGPDSTGLLDWFHLNSIEKDHRGNYLLSARAQCTIFYISGIDGSVIWRLGGPHSDWVDMSEGRALDFCYQHHVRWVDSSHTRITLFDNARWDNDTAIRNHSRGIVLELDHFTREVRLQHAYEPADGLLSRRLGSVQVLTDTPGVETTLVGWGEEPAWTEYTPDGTILADVRFGPSELDRDSFDNYRALKQNWTGRPRWPPSIAPGPVANYVYDSNGTFHVKLEDDLTGLPIVNDTVYFSWNGATEIKNWVILASNDTADLRIWRDYVKTVAKAGFEDYTYVGANTRYVGALAIDVNNSVIGSTPVLDMHLNQQLPGLAGVNGTFPNATARLTTWWQNFDKYGRGGDSLTSEMYRLYISHPIATKAATGALLFCLVVVVLGMLVLLNRWRRARKASYTPVVHEDDFYLDDDQDDDAGRGGEKQNENDSMFSFSDDGKRENGGAVMLQELDGA